MLLAITFAAASPLPPLRASRIEPATVVSAASPRVHTMSSFERADRLGQEDAGRDDQAVEHVEDAGAIEHVDVVVVEEVRGQADAAADQAGAGDERDVHAGDVGRRRIAAEQAVAALGVEVRAGEVSVTSDAVDVMSPRAGRRCAR